MYLSVSLQWSNSFDGIRLISWYRFFFSTLNSLLNGNQPKHVSHYYQNVSIIAKSYMMLISRWGWKVCRQTELLIFMLCSKWVTLSVWFCWLFVLFGSLVFQFLNDNIVFFLFYLLFDLWISKIEADLWSCSIAFHGGNSKSSWRCVWISQGNKISSQVNYRADKYL